jgi:bifunctional DNA primase/polymerase-like protein
MGFIVPFLDISSDLLLAAELYLSLGWSVIPLYGGADPSRPKVAAVPWSAYQSRRATLAQARYWFVEKGFQGIGIVTGRISNLVILDFDDPELFLTFRQQYSYLVEREVIQTRRGYHIYFQIPSSFPVPTRKGQGVDLLSEGCYAVARPTTIEGVPYKAIVGGAPRLLNAHDLQDILTFFDHHAAPLKASKPVPALPSATSSPLNAGDLQAFYRAQVGQGRGRNQSLFTVALTARDHGWSLSGVQAALADLHARMPAIRLHSTETEHQRQQEALRTIRSAFSHPARAPQPIKTSSPQLPTSAREALYAFKQTCVVRVIEGLRKQGIQPDQGFTRQQAIQLLSGIVGRDSIDHALQALSPDGNPLVESTTTPSGHPPAASAAADENPQIPITKCILLREKKSGQFKTGPKPRRYIMPSNTELCRKLGVQFSSSDPLHLDDLASARKTRQAAHRELFRRRPGKYHRRWLARRLGVSIRTIQHYNIELHIRRHPTYAERPITWADLDYIPDFRLDGTFLQDEAGKRYPARREIAARLLNQGHRLVLMRQQANCYSLDAPSVFFSQAWKLQQACQTQIQQHIAVEQGRAETIPHSPARPAERPRSDLPPPDPPRRVPLPLPDETRSPMVAKSSQKAAPRLSKRRARQPLSDVYLEALAQRIYSVINDRTPDPRQRISQATARRCVVTYGTTLVEQTLRLLQSRNNLTKPVGFFITVLRSESKRSL